MNVRHRPVSIVRSPEQMERAHTVLSLMTNLLHSYADLSSVLDTQSLANMVFCRQTLCWVLQHPDGIAIERLLEKTQNILESAGYEIICSAPGISTSKVH